MTRISACVLRWNAETRRQEYWTGAGWTTDPGQAQLLSAAEARRTAKAIGGKAEDAPESQYDHDED